MVSLLLRKGNRDDPVAIVCDAWLPMKDEDKGFMN